MANQMKGEARFPYDGQDWVLLYDANALLEIEDRLDLGLFALFAQLQRAEQDAKSVKIGTLATILQCGLVAHHPDITRSDTAEMLLSGDPAVQEAIGTAITLMMPQTGDAGTRPPTPAGKAHAPANKRAGTGRKR
jgi:hypothetical protein